MKDLIIGIIIGALITSAVFVYAGQTRRVDRMEGRIETICTDIERITHKIGGLPEKVRKK